MIGGSLKGVEGSTIYHFPRGNKHQEKAKLRQSSGPRLDPGTGRMQVRRVAGSVRFFGVTRLFALLKAQGGPAVILYS
jgi:hypothetical protein